jgi:hypothetical protein
MPGKSYGRSTAKIRSLKKQMRAERMPCYICRLPINYEAKQNEPDSFELEHILPMKTHPHLAEDPANLGPSHSSCNRSKGARDVVFELGNLAPEF